MTPSASVSDRSALMAGMSCVNTSGSERIPILMETVGALSRAQTPQDVLREFSQGMSRIETQRGYVSLSTRGLPAGQYRITRMIPDFDSSYLNATDPWRDSHLLTVHTGGFFGEIIRQAYPEIIHNFHLKGDPVVGDALSKFGSAMAIPLFDNGEPLNWAVMLRIDDEGFTITDLEESILQSNLVGSTVRNVLAAQQLREANARIQREVEQIARIQRALLPDRLPEIAGVALGASYATFDTAGGDHYDFIPQRTLNGGRDPDPDGPWDIQIADASGHGPAAATVVAMLNAILSASPHDMEQPGELLTFANRHLHEKRLESTFVTAILARYEPKSRTLTYARAGHNPALLMTRHPDRVEMERLEAVGSVPLGVMPDAEYEEATVELAPGQTLVLYTDGITEAMDPDGGMFDVAGIERSLTACSGAPDCVIGHVTAALKTHEAGRRPADDQTLLVMRVND